VKVYDRVYKGLPLVPFLSQMNPFHNLRSNFCKIHFRCVREIMRQDIIFFVMSVRLIRLSVCLHGTAGLSLPFFILVYCVETPCGRFSSNKLVGSSLFCKFVGTSIATYTSMPDDPKQSHRMPGGNVIQRLLALLCHWSRYFVGLNGFQTV
jgi:hypothetical protein